MAARIADNKVSESAWDADLLRFDLGTLQTHDFDLALTGFDMPDLGNFIESGAVTSQVFAGGGMPASAGTPVEDPVPPPFEFKPPNEEQTESSQEFTVVVTLESAEDQQELFTELRDRGLRVKA